jgi:hypothetical protein
MLQRLKTITGSKSSKNFDALSKASLKSLSFVNKNFGGAGTNPIIEEESMSTKTGSTSRNT